MAKLLIMCDPDDGWCARLVEGFAADHLVMHLAQDEVSTLASRDDWFDLSILEAGVALDTARDLLGLSRLGAIIAIAPPENEEIRVAAFRGGAADCVAKSTPLRELRLRVGGLLRRRMGAAPGVQAGAPARGRLVVDVPAQLLISPRGHRVGLSSGEFHLLCTFAERPGRVLDRDFLIGVLHGPGEVASRTIDVRVSRLRRKLLAQGAASDLIEVVRGEGYRLSCKVSLDPAGRLILG